MCYFKTFVELIIFYVILTFERKLDEAIILANVILLLRWAEHAAKMVNGKRL